VRAQVRALAKLCAVASLLVEIIRAEIVPAVLCGILRPEKGAPQINLCRIIWLAPVAAREELGKRRIPGVSFLGRGTLPLFVRHIPKPPFPAAPPKTVKIP
jgi:hypothetical protein